MSFYTVYTHKRMIPVITFHRCSKCGKTVIQKQTLTVTSNHNTKGAYTNARIEKRERAAMELLSQRETELKNKLKDINAESDFVLFRLNGRCNSCGNVEPWARIRSTVLETALSILRIFGVFAVLIGIMSLLSHKAINQLSPLIYWVVGAWLLTELAYLIYKLVFRSMIRKLPPQSLPKVCQTQEEAEKCAYEAGVIFR